MRFCIGELGMALLMVTGVMMGFHLMLVILIGVKLVGVFYWLLLGVPAFALALFHPNPRVWDKQ